VWPSAASYPRRRNASGGYVLLALWGAAFLWLVWTLAAGLFYGAPAIFLLWSAGALPLFGASAAWLNLGVPPAARFRPRRALLAWAAALLIAGVLLTVQVRAPEPWPAGGTWATRLLGAANAGGLLGAATVAAAVTAPAVRALLRRVRALQEGRPF
jgi:hypothetical protein